MGPRSPRAWPRKNITQETIVTPKSRFIFTTDLSGDELFTKRYVMITRWLHGDATHYETMIRELDEENYDWAINTLEYLQDAPRRKDEMYEDALRFFPADEEGYPELCFYPPDDARFYNHFAEFFSVALFERIDNKYIQMKTERKWTAIQRSWLK
jgi:hypothetical protein